MSFPAAVVDGFLFFSAVNASFLCSIIGSGFFTDFKTLLFFAASSLRTAILANKYAFSFSFRLNFFSLLVLVGTTLTPFGVDVFLLEIDSFFIGFLCLRSSSVSTTSTSLFTGGCSVVAMVATGSCSSSRCI